MSRCDQEMCPYWTGDGCACAVFDLDPTEAKADLEAWLSDGSDSTATGEVRDA